MILISSGIKVALLTFLARVFGFAREIFTASLFGAGSTADAVNIALKLPNLFRRIFAEGAFSLVFVPIFSSKLLESKRSATEFAGKILILLTIILIIFTLILEIFMPSVILLIAPGFQQNPEKFELTIILCRITTPYLIFISIVALFGGMLNSINRFNAFAITPSIFSFCIILITFIFKENINPAISFVIAILFAGVLQLFFILICVINAKLTMPMIFRFNDRDIKKFYVKIIPAILTAGAQQLNLFVSQSIASFIQGAISTLSYADRIYQFPLSIIGTTYNTILLPELSKSYHLKNKEKIQKLQYKAIQISLLLSLPSAFGIGVLSDPIVQIIYEHGVFNVEDTIKTAFLLRMFALGLPAFILSKIFTPIFYANHDTKNPFKITIISLIINILANLILIKFLHAGGIALGTSIAGWVNLYLLYFYTKQYNCFYLNIALLLFFLKVLFCCIIMTLSLNIIQYYSFEYYCINNFFLKLILLICNISAGIIIYFSMLLTCKITPKYLIE